MTCFSDAAESVPGQLQQSEAAMLPSAGGQAAEERHLLHTQLSSAQLCSLTAAAAEPFWSFLLLIRVPSQQRQQQRLTRQPAEDEFHSQHNPRLSTT